jgi:hypothetical protein
MSIVCKSRARAGCTFVHVRETDAVPLQELTASENSSPFKLANVGVGKYFQDDPGVARRMPLSAVCPPGSPAAFLRSGEAGKMVW